MFGAMYVHTYTCNAVHKEKTANCRCTFTGEYKCCSVLSTKIVVYAYRVARKNLQDFSPGEIFSINSSCNYIALSFPNAVVFPTHRNGIVRTLKRTIVQTSRALAERMFAESFGKPGATNPSSSRIWQPVKKQTVYIDL